MEDIVAFLTRDGKVFQDFDKAKAHEDELDFNDWYNDNELFGIYAGSRVEVGEIKEWLRLNREQVLKFLGHAQIKERT